MIKDLTRQDRAMLVFAFRYALPRHTGAVIEVMDYIKANINDFEDWELENMIDDCDFILRVGKPQFDEYEIARVERIKEYFLNQLWRMAHEEDKPRAYAR